MDNILTLFTVFFKVSTNLTENLQFMILRYKMKKVQKSSMRFYIFSNFAIMFCVLHVLHFNISTLDSSLITHTVSKNHRK